MPRGPQKLLPPLTAALGTDLDLRPLTAAAERVTEGKSEIYRRLNQPWQTEAFAAYRTLGECWYPAQFYAHSLPLVRFYAGLRNPQGEVKELEPDDWASEQLSRIQDPGGGRSQLLSAFGRLNFLTGDGYLVGQMDEEEDAWEFLSASELRAIPGTRPVRYARVYFPGATPEELTMLPDDDFEPLAEGAVVYRIWNRDPEYTYMADSPVRAVLPLYSQLALLEAAVTARARSRIANAKLLVLAQELSFGPADGKNADNSNTSADLRRLQEAMVRPIKFPGAASAVAPPTITAPSDMIAAKGVYELIDLSPAAEDKYHEIEARNEIRNRIALGLDMPAEIMLGLADSNHWNAFQIDEASWNAHLKPVVIRLCDDLGSAYLRPLARKEGKEYSEGQLVVWFDESEVVNHPNHTEDVRLAYQDGVAGSSIYLTTIGLNPDEDGPTEEDRVVWAEKYGRGRPEDLKQAADPNAPVIVPGDTQPAADGKNPGKPPEPTPEELANQSANVTASAFAEQAVGAANMAVIRCRALAGSRLRSKLKAECPEVPNAFVASALGAENLGSEPALLVATGADEYREWLLAGGVEASLVERVGKLVEAHAAASLCEPVPLSDGNTAFLRKSLAPLRVAA